MPIPAERNRLINSVNERTQTHTRPTNPTIKDSVPGISYSLTPSTDACYARGAPRFFWGSSPEELALYPTWKLILEEKKSATSWKTPWLKYTPKKICKTRCWKFRRFWVKKDRRWENVQAKPKTATCIVDTNQTHCALTSFWGQMTCAESERLFTAVKIINIAALG